MKARIRRKRFADAAYPQTDYLEVDLYRKQVFFSFHDFRHPELPKTAGVSLDRSKVLKLMGYLHHFLAIDEG